MQQKKYIIVFCGQGFFTTHSHKSFCFQFLYVYIYEKYIAVNVALRTLKIRKSGPYCILADILKKDLLPWITILLRNGVASAGVYICLNIGRIQATSSSNTNTRNKSICTSSGSMSLLSLTHEVLIKVKLKRQLQSILSIASRSESGFHAERAILIASQFQKNCKVQHHCLFVCSKFGPLFNYSNQ